VPRDLETIALKCLRKHPGRRYPRARDLADDLQAFEEGRPIRARRPGPWERSWRWLRRQRTSAVSAAVTVLVVLGLAVGWLTYSPARLGAVRLLTDGPPLTAEFLDEHDEAVLPPTLVPMHRPVELPAGAYRVRLSARWRPSETYHLLVERGGVLQARVRMSDRALFDPLACPVGWGGYGFDVIKLGRHADVLVRSHAGG